MEIDAHAYDEARYEAYVARTRPQCPECDDCDCYDEDDFPERGNDDALGDFDGRLAMVGDRGAFSDLRGGAA